MRRFKIDQRKIMEIDIFVCPMKICKHTRPPLQQPIQWGKLMFCLLSLIFVSKLHPQVATPIAEIYKNTGAWLFQEVTVVGIVTMGADRLDNTRLLAYIQDESDRGIQIFHETTNADFRRDIIIGNMIQVTGIFFKNGENASIAMKDYQLLRTEQAVPVTFLKISEIAPREDLEGSHIKIINELMPKRPVRVDDGYDLRVRWDIFYLTIRVLDTTFIKSTDSIEKKDISEIKRKSTISASGIVMREGNQYVLLPGYQDSFQDFSQSTRVIGTIVGLGLLFLIIGGAFWCANE